MTKIVIDKALIEQAIAALFDRIGVSHFTLRQRLRAALVEPAVDTVAEIRSDAMGDLSYLNGLKAGWNFCVANDQAGYVSAVSARSNALHVLKTPPPPADVPLLDDKSILCMWHETADRVPMCEHYKHFARAIEQAVRHKAGLK